MNIKKEPSIILNTTSDLAKSPKIGSSKSSGMDLYSIEDVNLNPNETKLVETGLKVEHIDGNFELQIRPRSGMAVKKSVSVLNTPGTIDNDYRGEIKIILHNHSNEKVFIEKHTRIAQMVMAPVVYAANINIQYGLGSEKQNKTDRGEKGFGSTGYN